MEQARSNASRSVGRWQAPAFVVLGVYHLALGVLMMAAPGTFFRRIGGYGVRNDHYIRDTSTFYLALGAVMLLAVRRPRWRVPLLVFAVLEYAAHLGNHLADVSKSHPAWQGPFAVGSLVVLLALLGWLLWDAWRGEAGAE
jgi:hypothetical protein